MSDRILLESGDVLLTEAGDGFALEIISGGFVVNPELTADLILFRELFAPTIGLRTESNLPLVTEAGEALLQESMAADLIATAQGFSGTLESYFPLDASLSGSAGLSSALTTEIHAASLLALDEQLTAGLTTEIKASAAFVSSASLEPFVSTAITLVTPLSGESFIQGSIATAINLSAAITASPVITAPLLTEIDLFASLISVSNAASADCSTAIRLSASLEANSNHASNISTQCLISAGLSSSLDASAPLSTAIKFEAALTSISECLSADVFIIPAHYECLIYIQSAFSADLSTTISLAASIPIEESLSAEALTGIRLATDLQSNPLLTSNILTEIDAFASAISVSNVGHADLLTAIQGAAILEQEASLSPEILTEILIAAAFVSEPSLSLNLLTEIDAFASTISVSNLGNADLLTSIDSATALVQDATLSPDLLTGITASAPLITEASVSSSLSTEINLSASESASASMAQVNLSTSINVGSPLLVEASLSPDLLTGIKASAALGSEASLSPSLLTKIDAFASAISVSNVGVAELSTTIQAAALLSSESDAQSSLTNGIRLSSSVFSEASVSPSIATGINAFASAISVSNVGAASLTTEIDCAGQIVAAGATDGSLTCQILIASALEAQPSVSPLLLTEIDCESSVVSGSTVSGDLSATIAMASLLAVAPDLQGAVTSRIRLQSSLAATPVINPDLQTSINLLNPLGAESTASGGITTGISLEASATTSASSTAQITTGIKAQAALNAETSAAADLRTEIDAFAAVIAVSNVQTAKLTNALYLEADIYSGLNFTLEDGSYFLTEAGDRLLAVSNEAILDGVLGFAVEFNAGLYCESKTTVGLTAQILVSAAANAIASASNSLTTGLTFRANATSLSETTAALTTSIRPESNLLASSSFDSSLTTKLNAVAALLNVSTLAPALSNSIQLAASPSVLAALTASIQTRIAVQSSTSASPALSSSLSVIKNLATTLNSNAVFVAEMKTAINALTALIGVSNIADASLTVTRLDPVFTPFNNQIYLAELQAYDPTTSSVITWRFASGQGYDNGGVFYPPRIEQPANLKRSIGGSNVGGRTSMSYGELTLANLDGGINAIADDYFDGRTLTLKRGNSSMPYNTFTTVLVATVESVAMERERASIRLRDKAITLDQPFSTVKYAGTNSNGAGIEGTADDIKGQSKPRIFGRIALMPPTMVNSSKLIYQINAGAVDNVINVFDAGAYLTRSTDYTSQVDMEGNDPASGTWRAWPGGGCIRLGSVPFGQVSVCVAEKWDYSQCTAAGLIQRILTEVGYTSANWMASDFTALNQKNAGSLGVVVSDGETTAALLDRICQSVGAWWGFDSLGRFRVARLDAPSGTASATLTDNQILELERQAADQLPVWQTVLKSDINYAQQDKKSLAGVVPANRASWFEQESRDQKVENASVKTQRLLAEDQTYDSLLNGISVANAESARRLALFSSRRDTVNLTVANPSEYYSSIDLGSVISVQTSKLGYDTGRLMTVTAVSLDYQANTLDITCWG